MAEDKDPYESPRRLVPKLSRMGSKHLSDEFLAIAYNIEEAFLHMGAQAGYDYDFDTLMNLAQPFVLQMFTNDPEFVYSYPSDNVAPPPPSP